MRFTAVTLAWLHACAMFVWEVSAMDEYVASPRVNLEHEADDYDPPMSTTYDEMGFVRVRRTTRRRASRRTDRVAVVAAELQTDSLVVFG